MASGAMSFSHPQWHIFVFHSTYKGESSVQAQLAAAWHFTGTVVKEEDGKFLGRDSLKPSLTVS